MNIFCKLGKTLSHTSLDRQLSLLMVAGFTLLVAMIFISMRWISTNFITKQNIHESKRLTAVFAQQSALSLLYGSKDNSQAALDMVLSFPSVKQAAIYDIRHNLLHQKKIDEVQEWQWHNKVNQFTSKNSELEYENKDFWQFIAPVFDREIREEETPFEIQKETASLIGYVKLLKSKKEQKLLLTYIIVTNTVASAIIAILLLIALKRIGKRITKPLAVLAKTMAQAKEKQADLEVALDGASELRQIGASFNEMMSILKTHQEQLKEYARLKEEFTANMSHEIRTPLTGIVSVIDLLQNGNLSKQEQEDLLKLANSSSKLLTTIVNDILDFSKISAGKLKVESIYLNLQKLLEEIVSLYSSKAKEKNLKLYCRYQQDMPTSFKGDPFRIQQVFNNLVSNAIKFTEQGEIIIKASLLSKEEDYTLVKIEVQDTGIGIPASKHEKIFNSYSQSGSSISRKYGGTGLGLAICKQLIKLMNGTITLLSEPKKGSNFIVKLPLQETTSDLSSEQPQFIQKVEQNFTKTKKVLLVEDNIVNQKVTLMALKNIGIQVGLAEDGEQAIAAVQQTNYDLILMDCQLPGIDGLEATRQIRALNYNMPILALTANAEPEDIKKYKKSGMNHVIVKPFETQKLTEALEKWL